jgi:hypothetical protein
MLNQFRKNVNFISEILKSIRIHLRTMLGVHLIKRDGVGSTGTGAVMLMYFMLILLGSILGTIAHYELHTIVEFIAVFRAHIMPQIHKIMFIFSFLVEN